MRMKYQQKSEKPNVDILFLGFIHSPAQKKDQSFITASTFVTKNKTTCTERDYG